jgi:tRNA uracil 4-sulfurtransferase
MRPSLRDQVRHDVALARYGEIGLKSRPVRRRFEAALQENIERAFEQEGLDGIVTRIPGRFLVHSSDLSRAQSILARIFGLTSVSLARTVPSQLPALLEQIPRYFDELAATLPAARTFALRVRRNGQHPYTSQDVARQGGGTVLDRPGGDRWKVDLETPDVELSIEIRDHQAFLFSGRQDAPGGLPVGTQGKVVVLLKDVHSVVAAWLMMKRGCTLVPVTFTGPTGAPERARTLLGHLSSPTKRHASSPRRPLASSACARCCARPTSWRDARRRKPS